MRERERSFVCLATDSVRPNCLLGNIQDRQTDRKRLIVLIINAVENITFYLAHELNKDFTLRHPFTLSKHMNMRSKAAMLPGCTNPQRSYTCFGEKRENSFANQMSLNSLIKAVFYSLMNFNTRL